MSTDICSQSLSVCEALEEEERLLKRSWAKISIMANRCSNGAG